MSAVGYDPVSGFTPATFVDVKSDIETRELADVDAELDTSADQPIGQINAIFASKQTDLWELLAVMFGALDDSKAEGALLENIAALTGTYRYPAQAGTVLVQCALTAGTVLSPIHRVSRSDEPSSKWRPKATFTAPSTGTHDVPFECVTTGPLEAPAGTLTVIDTPVSGWTTANNASDADPGRNVETDAELRVRRRAELDAQGATNTPTIKAAVDKVKGVISVLVLENTSDAYDGNGLPPHSFQVVIWDGVSMVAVNADVWKAIYANMPAGIVPFGSIVTELTDEYGNKHRVAFERVTQVDIHVNVAINVDSSYAGDAAVKAAILAYGDSLLSGGDVVYRSAMGKVTAVAGVTDCPAFQVKKTGGVYSETNIPIGIREIAVFDTSRITVVVL